MNEIFVYPGQLAVARAHEATRIKTILGSCVSVVLGDATAKIAGLCHYLLPDTTQGAVPSPRYGDFAIPQLLRQMTDKGAEFSRIEAKLYGGGNVVNHLNRTDGNIGERNAEIALRLLKEARIPIIEQNLGGNKGRFIAVSCESFAVEHRFSDSERATLAGVEHQTARDRVKVLIVDDSATVRTIFSKMLGQSKNIEIVGTAVDPFDAREKILALKPDVITLDIEMPKMNGVAFLEKIMKHRPLPVIMVSSLGSQGEAAQRCLELGAVEFIHKPSQFDPALISELGEQLIAKVIAASATDLKHLTEERKRIVRPVAKSTGFALEGGLNLIVIGGNVGSPADLENLLCQLPSDTPPVVVANSNIVTFLEGFKQKVLKRAKVRIEVLGPHETLLKTGNVYLAAPDRHVKVGRKGSQVMAYTEASRAWMGQKPSADLLFESCAEHWGKGAAAILLSGFSGDGVSGLLALRERGCATLVQDPEETTFSANATAAIDRAAATVVVTIDAMPDYLLSLRNQRVLSVASAS